MNLELQNTKEKDWILIHDFYKESMEPDAPKASFGDLNQQDQQRAFSQYSTHNYRAVLEGERIIGFVGFFPDDNENVNLFYVIAPECRGNRYFSKLLEISIPYCRREFPGFKYIRALTRKQNTPSIRGLERLAFFRNGTVIEEIQPDVVYEEYLLSI